MRPRIFEIRNLDDADDCSDIFQNCAQKNNLKTSWLIFYGGSIYRDFAMAIYGLGYLGIRSDQIDYWSDFASKLLGMQQVDRAGKTLAFRMDDRKQRLIVSDEAFEITTVQLDQLFTFRMRLIEGNVK